MPMTESEWNACTDPEEMEFFLGSRLSHRRLRLFGCACVRGVWKHLPEDALRQAIETCERFADGLATVEELTAAKALADATYQGMGDIISDHSAIAVAGLCEQEPWFPMGDGSSAGISAVAAEAWSDEETPWHVAWAHAKKAHSKLLRDICGNPFHPIVINAVWLTPAVTTLASAAYEELALPSGELDYARLAGLADALVQAGCQDAATLGHLRSPGRHVRGCWAVDAILGKE
jgi:hypothetical protein